MAFLYLIPHLSLKSGEVAPPPISHPRSARRETLRSNSSLEDRP